MFNLDVIELYQLSRHLAYYILCFPILCLLLMNDNCTRFNIKEGDKVKVQFDMKAREWENKGYNTLNAWKVDKVL
jgi:hypothetical protein